jgi:hypothetical protein
MGYIWIHETSGTSRFVDAKYLPPCNTCGEYLDKCKGHEKEKEDGQDGIATRGDHTASDGNNN